MSQGMHFKFEVISSCEWGDLDFIGPLVSKLDLLFLLELPVIPYDYQIFIEAGGKIIASKPHRYYFDRGRDGYLYYHTVQTAAMIT